VLAWQQDLNRYRLPDRLPLRSVFLDEDWLGRVIAMTEENNEVIRGLNISNHLQLVECQLWLVKSFFSFVETSGCSSKPCSDRQVSCMTSWGRQPTHRRKWCHFLEDFRNPRHAVATGWFPLLGVFCSLPFDELSPFDHVVTVSFDHVKNVVFCEQAEPSKQSVLLSFICIYIYRYMHIVYIMYLCWYLLSIIYIYIYLFHMYTVYV